MAFRATLRRSSDRDRAPRSWAWRGAAALDALLARLLSLPVLGWRYLVSPVLGPNCRYLPSCSDYALEALRAHGAWRGAGLAVRRIARCHPWGGSGLDPVPPAHCHHDHPQRPRPDEGAPEAGSTTPS